jgi:hypothetical protein
METRKKTTIIGALVAGAVLTIASVGVAAAQTPDATPSTTPPAQSAPATPGDGEHPCPKDGTGHRAKGEMRGQMGQMTGEHGARHAAMHAGSGA